MASRFRRNILAGASSNLIAQAVQFAALPFISRLYSVEEFAAFAIFVSMVSLVTAVSTARIDWIIPNANNEATARRMHQAGVFFLMVVTTVCGIVIVVLNLTTEHQDGVGLNCLLPLAVLGGGYYQLSTAWFVRQADLRATAQAKVVNALGCTGVQIVGGINGALGSFGLAAGLIIGNLFAGLRLLALRWRGLVALPHLDHRRLWAVFGHVWSRCATSSGVSLLNTAGVVVIPLMLAVTYGAQEVGYFALVQRVALAPAQFLSAAIAQSFWAEAAQMARTDRPALSSLLRKTTIQLGLVSCPLALACALGPWYIGAVFGQQWINAGILLPAIIPLVVASAVVAPTNVLVVFNRQHWQLLVDAVRLILTLSIIVVAGFSSAPLWLAVLEISLASAFSQFLLFVVNRHAISHG